MKIGLMFSLIIVMSVLVNAAESDSKVISVSLVNQDPDPAIAGDIVELRIGVENKGGVSAQNLIIEVVPEYPFEQVKGEALKKKIGTLRSYQDEADMKIIKYKVRVDRDATAGQYELKVRHYEEGSKTAIQRTVNIDIKNRESAEVIHIDKTTLVPGKQTPLKFTINNVGNAPLRDMTFHWINGDKVILPVGSDNTKYIKYVDIGESAELEYEVIADPNAEPGLYELNLYLSYDDPLTGEDKEIATIAGVNVGGDTDFDVSFSEGSAMETSFSVANIGSNPANSVSIIIPRQSAWNVVGSNSVIVGNLNKGDYTIASFSLKPRSSTDERTAETRQQSPSTIEVQVAYTNTMGDRQTITKEVGLNLQSLMPSSGMDARRGMGTSQQGFLSRNKWKIAIFIILIFAIWYYRKDKARLKRFFKKHK